MAISTTRPQFDLSKHLIDPRSISTFDFNAIRDLDDGHYRVSEGERACLESFAIQNFGVEDEDFRIELVYPERVPIEHLHGRGLLPRSDYGDAHFVFSVMVRDKEHGIIQTEIGMWDRRPRIKRLWAGSREEAQDPADVMDFGEEKYVSVREERGDGIQYRCTRGLRTHYEAAGGAQADPRRGQRGQQWLEERTAQMRTITFNFSDNSHAPVRAEPIRHQSRWHRHTLDRAHADEMHGPSASDVKYD